MKFGVDVNVSGEVGDRFFYLAFVKGFFNIVKFLMEEGSKVDGKIVCLEDFCYFLFCMYFLFVFFLFIRK